MFSGHEATDQRGTFERLGRWVWSHSGRMLGLLLCLAMSPGASDHSILLSSTANGAHITMKIALEGARPILLSASFEAIGHVHRPTQ
jgi:hypothetical protein